MSAARRDDVLARVTDACLAGGQAYWVCPLIEESEKLQLQTAEDTHAALAVQLPELNIGLVHGRLKPADKQAVMEAFQSGAIHLLVATTVIEVGVDVPNAALMVIEHAVRMGLAQLHQPVPVSPSDEAFLVELDAAMRAPRIEPLQVLDELTPRMAEVGSGARSRDCRARSV